MNKVKTTHYKDGKPVETVEEDYVPTNMHITTKWAEQMKEKRTKGKFKK